MSKKQCIIIAIAGASASGKTLIAQTIYKELKEDIKTDEIAVITEDSYYKDQSHIKMSQRVSINYDHPQQIDHDLLHQQIEDLKNKKTIHVPIYDYTVHNRTDQFRTITPKKVIIIEGILLLNCPKIRELADTSIFIDTPLDICLTRRLKRDLSERGRKLQDILDQYHQTVRPMFLQFIEPSKQYADIIIPRGGKNRIAIEILKSRIQNMLV